MKILITGAEGFAGSHLIDHCLAQGDDVWGTCWTGAKTTNIAHVLDHVTLRVGDLTKPDFIRGVLQEARFDALFHLAGISYVRDAEQQPARAYESNLIAGIHLLEAVRSLSAKTRVVLVSSAEVYGPVKPEHLPVTENHPFAPPVTIFAAAKAALELAVHPLILSYGVQVVIARPFNHTGPRQRPDFVCSTFAEQVAKVEMGGEKVISVGDLSPRRDFSDVRDIVRGYRMLAQKGVIGESYNLATGNSVTVQEILDVLVNMSRVKVEIRQDPARLRGANQVMDVRGSIEKVKAATGWAPEIPLEKTLKDLLNWHRDRLSKRIP